MSTINFHIANPVVLKQSRFFNDKITKNPQINHINHKNQSKQFNSFLRKNLRKRTLALVSLFIGRSGPGGGQAKVYNKLKKNLSS